MFPSENAAQGENLGRFGPIDYCYAAGGTARQDFLKESS